MSCTGVPSAREGRNAQHVSIVEIEYAFVGIFGQQRVEHGAGLGAVLREHVTLFDVLGALAAGERLLVEGDMADEVEGIEVLAKFFGDRIERQALGLQFLDDRLLAFRRLPAFQEIIEAGEALLQRLLGEVAQDLGDELAVLVEILHPLGDDGGADAIDINLFRLARRPAAMVMSGGPSTMVSSAPGLSGSVSPSSPVGGTSSGGAMGSPSPGS